MSNYEHFKWSAGSGCSNRLIVFVAALAALSWLLSSPTDTGDQT